jgi:hypothetical protein
MGGNSQYIDATPMVRSRTAPGLLSDRRHHELLVKFSRIVVWSERELTTLEPWHAPPSDSAMPHAGVAQTCHA